MSILCILDFFDNGIQHTGTFILEKFILKRKPPLYLAEEREPGGRLYSDCLDLQGGGEVCCLVVVVVCVVLFRVSRSAKWFSSALVYCQGALISQLLRSEVGSGFFCLGALPGMATN